MYRARPAEFDVRRVVPVRDYANVTIYTAKDTGTGKVRASRTPDLAPRLVRQLLDHYGERAKERRVLAVVAASDEMVKSFSAAFAGAGFAEFAVTNWGRVDGRNEWRHFDTLLVGTLHYGTNTQDTIGATAQRLPKTRSTIGGPRSSRRTWRRSFWSGSFRRGGRTR